MNTVYPAGHWRLSNDGTTHPRTRRHRREAEPPGAEGPQETYKVKNINGRGKRSDTSSHRLDLGSPARRKGSGYRENGVAHLRFSVNDGAMITIFFKINKISRLFSLKSI